MAVTRKEQIASGKKVTPLTREELRLASKTFAPLTEEERFHKVAYGGITPTGELEVTENGDFDVTNYESAKVNVPASAVVSGTKNITQNGTVDVTNYAQADVNVKGAETYKLTISNQLSNTSLTVHGPFYDEYTGVYNTQWPLNSSPMTKEFYVNRKSNGGQLTPTATSKYINIVMWAQTPTNIPSGKKVKVSTDSGTLKIADIQNTAGNYYEACIVVKNMDRNKTLTFEFEDA